jgi:hypothetical protein
MFVISKALGAVLIVAATLSAVPAFPGAEGWGKNSTGGRDGQVIHVRTLSSSGPGSLRDACQTVGPKIIVFDTAGVIDLGDNPITINSNTYIAGQTAPGGITLKKGGLYTQASNIIVRFIRLRRSSNAADGDLIRTSSANAHDIIFDHCSAYWCSDEILDMCYGCYNITIQNTIIAEPLECTHIYCDDVGCGNNRTGILSTDNDGRITFYKMVMTHAMKRSPMCSNGGKTSNVEKTYELINSVFYNCMANSSESFDNGNTIPLNLIGNYYKGGPSADYGSNPYPHSGTVNVTPRKMNAYVNGNFHYKYPALIQPTAFFNGQSVITPFSDAMIEPVMTTNILPVQTAFWECMASAGPLPRDSTEKSTFREIIDKTGVWHETCNVVAEPIMRATGSVPLDTDRDGMPDTWEVAKGLNPNNVNDRTTDMGGYNAVEVYLNELADTLVARASVSIEEARSTMGSDAAPFVEAIPNPFNPVVKFTLANMNSKPVMMSVYDITGRQIYKSGFLTDHSNLFWNAKDIAGKSMGTGTYVVKFIQDNLVVKKQITLIR